MKPQLRCRSRRSTSDAQETYHCQRDIRRNRKEGSDSTEKRDVTPSPCSSRERSSDWIELRSRSSLLSHHLSDRRRAALGSWSTSNHLTLLAAARIRGGNTYIQYCAAQSCARA